MIVKKSDGYHVVSEKGKHLGGPYSKKQAEKRLAQIEYFKHVKKESIKLLTFKQFILEKFASPALKQQDKSFDIIKGKMNRQEFLEYLLSSFSSNDEHDKYGRPLVKTQDGKQVALATVNISPVNWDDEEYWVFKPLNVGVRAI